MKNILLLSLLCFLQISYAQIQSSCTANQAVLDLYSNDADNIAFQITLKESTNYIDSIVVNKSLADTILDALIAVYNAHSQESKAITDTFQIHTFGSFFLNNYVLAANGNLPWMQQYANGNNTSGNQILDSLNNFYGFSFIKYYSFAGALGYHVVVFGSLENYNILKYSELISSLNDVIYAEPNGIIGDGNRIDVKINADHVELIYSYGFGDCPSGCTARTYWKFKVYFDCSVEFVERYGDNPYDSGFNPINPIDEILDFENINLSPNPFENTINIEGITKEFNFLLYNSFGQMVKEGKTNGSINGLVDLPKGLYFLQLYFEDHSLVKQVLKY